MDKIIFATGNKGKVESARTRIKAVNLEFFELHALEPQSDNIAFIAEEKVKQAYRELQAPCIALDSGFNIEALNNWPGALVDHNIKKLGPEGFIRLLYGMENRNAYFTECLAYHSGTEILKFYGISKGTISETISESDSEKKWSDLWKIFIPEGYNKTLSEMTDEERMNRPGLISSFDEFNDYLIKAKKLEK